MKFKTEQESINYFITRLSKKGWTNINQTQSTNKYSYFDVDAISPDGDLKIRFELKRRDVTSTTYDDCIMEKYKYDKFVEAISTGEIDRGYLVNFFDDCISFDNIKNPIKFDYLYANHTTEFSDNQIIKKNTVHYPKKNKYTYEYE